MPFQPQSRRMKCIDFLNVFQTILTSPQRPQRAFQVFRAAFGKIIAGFHCHTIKIKIENHSMNEVKKFTRYRR